MSRDTGEEDLTTWHRRFASRANDRAWTLSEKTGLSEGEKSELQEAAHAAAYHWREIGTEFEMAHADLLLGRVHALLGNGPLAVKHAQSAFDSISSRSSEKWELAFARAILANAASAAGDDRMHARHFAEAKQLGEELSGGERTLFLATFDLIPEPS